MVPVTITTDNTNLQQIAWHPLTEQEMANGAAAVLELAAAAAADVEDPEEDATEPTWEGVLAVEGITTSDNRYLMPGKIGHRDLPLTLMAQTVTADGHEGAWVAGKITNIWREDRPDLGEGAVAIMGSGVFANNEDGQRAFDLLEEEVLRGVSIDFAASETHLLDPETLDVLDDGEMDLMDLLSGNFVRGFEGDIMGATLCPFQAFEDATMQIVETPDKVVVASAFPIRKVLTASAAGIAPLNPPKEWFYTEETNGPCPLTVTADGRIYGHLALWNQCHRAVGATCEMAPRSKSGYAYFHTGSLTTLEGEKVNVGRITVGANGHASVSPYLGTQGAIEHYDETGTVGAFVRAKDGLYGIWLSGAVRSDCPAEKVRDMEANPPSGDWREENGRLELCAALSVPVAGFPVPRYEASLVASGADERVVALVASGYTVPGAPTRATQRRLETLKAEGRRVLARKKRKRGADEDTRDSKKSRHAEYADTIWMTAEELDANDEFAPTAEQRRRWAKSGVALPDGSFPITKCSGEGTSAENARRAIGRASEEKRGRVRSHIAKRERALGCSNE
jgi:hypothetical protein